MKRKLSGYLLIAVALCMSCDKKPEDTYEAKEPVQQMKSSKRGVSFNFQFPADLEVMAPGISWSYNWGMSQNSNLDSLVSNHNLDYCPMAWNGVNESIIRDYVARHPECKYLLAYNEPNLTDQANMTPTQAAEKWPALKALAGDLGLKIIAPAMNYGTLPDYHDPIVWLDEFFTLIPLDDVEGIAIHSYMPNASSVKSYIERFYKYNKPIWLTEFCAWDGLNEGSYKALSQREYMVDMLNYLEANPRVFRYAWFIPRGNGSEDNFPYMFLLKSYPVGELTELGQVFVQMSSQDSTTYFVEQQIIEAEKYSSISVAESVDASWTTGPKLRITTDAPNESLELYNFLPDQWVDYLIEADRSKEFILELRYATFTDTEIDIEVDGQLAGSHSLPNTSEDFIWSTSEFPLSLDEGKHTLRIIVTKGRLCLNWLSFN